MSVIEPGNARIKKLLVITSAAVLCTTLAAGLWPFSFRHTNEVRWKPEAGGLVFGNNGMVISQGRFPGAAPGRGGSIELWVEPGESWSTGTIFSFYERSEAPGIQVRQSGDDLLFSGSRRDGRGKSEPQDVFVDHVFRKGERVFIALVSAGHSLDFYVDGVLKKSVSDAALDGRDFTGTLIVANAYNEKLSWSGTVRGLALYDRALRPEEITEDYRSWRDKGRGAQNAVAAYSLFSFDGPVSDRLRNLGTKGPDLIIPKSYFVFEPGLLVPFWKEYRPGWQYAVDLTVNVFGLVPLGFCFAALLAWLKGRPRSLLYAALLGFLTSLTIEILQAFMPTRFSGMTDLVSNTLGAALGAWLYLNRASQCWLERNGLVRAETIRTDSADLQKAFSQS